MLFVLLITRVSNETNRTCQIAYDLFFGAEENTRQSLPASATAFQYICLETILLWSPGQFRELRRSGRVVADRRTLFLWMGWHTPWEG